MLDFVRDERVISLLPKEVKTKQLCGATVKPTTILIFSLTQNRIHMNVVDFSKESTSFADKLNSSTIMWF